MKQLLIYFVAAVSVCMYAQTHTVQASSEDASWPRTLEVTYCWGQDHVDVSCPVQRVRLHQDGRLFMKVGRLYEPGTWGYRKGRPGVRLEFQSTAVVLLGAKGRNGCYEGQMLRSTHGTPGVWEGCFVL